MRCELLVRGFDVPVRPEAGGRQDQELILRRLLPDILGMEMMLQRQMLLLPLLLLSLLLLLLLLLPLLLLLLLCCMNLPPMAITSVNDVELNNG